jgi:hypothetical protein
MTAPDRIEQLKKLIYRAKNNLLWLSLGEPNKVNQQEMNRTADYIRLLQAELNELLSETK